MVSVEENQFAGHNDKSFLGVSTESLEAAVEQLRQFSVQNGRNCLPMEAPHELKDFLSERKVIDSSNRNYQQELAVAAPLPCHHVPGQELPEKSLAYRWGKRHYFFGFGAYG